MKVNVLVNTNKLTLDEIDPLETVETIKGLIFEKFRDVSAPISPDNPLAHTYLSINHLRLLYKGKQLPKLSTLSEHSFKDDDTVLLYISQNKQEDPQDDKNAMVHSTLGDDEKSFKYTLTVKNECVAQAEAPDIDMLEELGQDELELLLKRLPYDILAPSVSDLPVKFDRSIAIPGKAQKIITPFPPNTTGTLNAGPSVAAPPARVVPLAVEAYSPIGKIYQDKPQIRVKFSQPMVPLGEFDKIQKTVPVPIKIIPEIDGSWVWSDPFTAVLNPSSQLPKSTEYFCAVQGELTSAVGGVMRDPVEWMFVTPSLALATRRVSFGGPRVQIFLRFNQPVQYDMVIQSLIVTTNQHGEYDYILDIRSLSLDKNENELHAEIKKLLKTEEEAKKLDECVVFEIEDDINGVGKTDSTEIEVEVMISPALLNLEKELKFKFKTVAALKVQPVQLFTRDLNGLQKKVVYLTNQDLQVRFNNQLFSGDPALVRNSISVEPEIPGMNVTASGSVILINGEKYPGDYKVTVKTSILDMYDQFLGKETTLVFPVTPPTNSSLNLSLQNTYLPFGSSAHQNNFITLDPTLPPVLHFNSTNVGTLHVRTYNVSDEEVLQKNYSAFINFLNKKDKDFPDAEEISRFDVGVVPPKINGKSLMYKEAGTAIDLSKSFGVDDSRVCGRSKYSNLLVVIRADDTAQFLATSLVKKYWITWSDVGVAFAADEKTIYGWSFSLLSGEPLPCLMRLISSQSKSVSIPLFEMKNAKIGGAFSQARGDPEAKCDCLVAKIGSRYSFVNIAKEIFTKKDKSKYIWHVLDDRKRYRPFDRVHMKGIIREIDYDQHKISYPENDSMEITYTVSDSRGKVLIGNTKAELKPSYCFDFDFELPGTMNLGPCVIKVQWGSASHSHTVDVQEYKRKAFEMVLKTDKSSVRPREPLGLVAYAQAFTGEVLSASTASWSVRVGPAFYSPPNLHAYKFNIVKSGDTESHQWESDRNYSGKHHLSVAVDDIVGPVTLTLICTVKDATNEALSATESTLVHPTDVYVGVRSEQQVVNFGEPYKLFVVTCTPDGKFTGDCGLRMYVRGVPFEVLDGENTPQDVSVLEQDLTPSDAGPIEVLFEPKFRGKHSITFVSTDLNGKQSSTDSEVWVYGKQSEAEKDYEQVKKKEKTVVKQINPPRHTKSLNAHLKLVMDRSENYEIDSVAELLVVSPFWPALGTMYVHKNGILLKAEKFSVTDSMTRIPIQVLTEYVPNVEIEVALFGMDGREPALTPVECPPEAEPEAKRPRIDNDQGPRIPARASARTILNVSKGHKKLGLVIAPSNPKVGPYLPGEEVSMDVSVVGPSGEPVVGAEVAVVVVDESVLALTGYTMKDPIETFFRSSFGSHLAMDSTHNNLIITRMLKEDLAPVQPDAGCITVMYFSGRILKFEVNNSITVAKLKTMVQERDGLPPPTQRLLFKGKQLPDEGTLAEHGVPDGSVINLVLRLFGGGLGDDKEIITNAAQAPIIRIRTNMNALAHFGPHLKTGENGKANCKFTLPDSLTRYRVMAVANTIDMFGKSETQIIASLPLMLRQSPPRFLNFGDTCVVPVMVQNELDTESEILVGVRAQNVDIATKGWKIKLPAHGRAAVPFHVKPVGPGAAIFQVAASDSKLITSDAAQFTFPIHTPTTSEVVASTGVIDGDHVLQQPIARFDDQSVVATSGGLEVSMASTIFQELTDAALYTMQYPHECSEQLSGRIISMVVFKDLLPLLHRSKNAKGDENPVPEPEKLGATIKKLVDTLLERRDSNGNFGYWQKGGRAYDYSSVYCYLAVGLAKQNGYEVPNNFLNGAATFLRRIVDTYTRKESKEAKEERKKATQSQRTLRWLRRNVSSGSATETDEVDPDHGLACFAMFVWNEITGDADTRVEEATKMMNRKILEKMPLEQIAYLLPTVLDNTATLKSKHRAVWEHINNNFANTTGAFVSPHNSKHFFRSDLREQAVVLSTLIACDPKNPNIVKMVRGLLDQRKNGRWYNTQDNAFALIAMQKYFNEYEKKFGNYVTDLWVGKGHVGRTEFDGQSTDTHVTQVSMKQLIEEEGSAVTLAKKGQGRMYYRIAVEYSPKALFLPPRDCGFKVSREYLPVLNKEDVVEGKDEGGNRRYEIKAGSLVRVKVEMIADGPRSYVALVDHFPGGLEPQNSSRYASGTNTGYSYIYKFWDHENIRDSRAEIFVDYLYPGAYKYSYVVRAITKGSFLVPPAKAEEMYSPDVFGRSDMMVVHVK